MAGCQAGIAQKTSSSWILSKPRNSNSSNESDTNSGSERLAENNETQSRNRSDEWVPPQQSATPSDTTKLLMFANKRMTRQTAAMIRSLTPVAGKSSVKRLQSSSAAATQPRAASKTKTHTSETTQTRVLIPVLTKLTEAEIRSFTKTPKSNKSSGSKRSSESRQSLETKPSPESKLSESKRSLQTNQSSDSRRLSVSRRSVRSKRLPKSQSSDSERSLVSKQSLESRRSSVSKKSLESKRSSGSKRPLQSKRLSRPKQSSDSDRSSDSRPLSESIRSSGTKRPSLSKRWSRPKQSSDSDQYSDTKPLSESILSSDSKRPSLSKRSSRPKQSSDSDQSSDTKPLSESILSSDSKRPSLSKRWSRPKQSSDSDQSSDTKPLSESILSSDSKRPQSKRLLRPKQSSDSDRSLDSRSLSESKRSSKSKRLSVSKRSLELKRSPKYVRSSRPERPAECKESLAFVLESKRSSESDQSSGSRKWGRSNLSSDPLVKSKIKLKKHKMVTVLRTPPPMSPSVASIAMTTPSTSPKHPDSDDQLTSTPQTPRRTPSPAEPLSPDPAAVPIWVRTPPRRHVWKVSGPWILMKNQTLPRPITPPMPAAPTPPWMPARSPTPTWMIARSPTPGRFPTQSRSSSPTPSLSPSPAPSQTPDRSPTPGLSPAPRRLLTPDRPSTPTRSPTSPQSPSPTRSPPPARSLSSSPELSSTIVQFPMPTRSPLPKRSPLPTRSPTITRSPMPLDSRLSGQQQTLLDAQIPVQQKTIYPPLPPDPWTPLMPTDIGIPSRQRSLKSPESFALAKARRIKTWNQKRPQTPFLPLVSTEPVKLPPEKIATPADMWLGDDDAQSILSSDTWSRSSPPKEMWVHTVGSYPRPGTDLSAPTSSPPKVETWVMPAQPRPRRRRRISAPCPSEVDMWQQAQDPNPTEVWLSRREQSVISSTLPVKTRMSIRERTPPRSPSMTPSLPSSPPEIRRPTREYTPSLAPSSPEPSYESRETMTSPAAFSPEPFIPPTQGSMPWQYRQTFSPSSSESSLQICESPYPSPSPSDPWVHARQIKQRQSLPSIESNMSPRAFKSYESTRYQTATPTRQSNSTRTSSFESFSSIQRQTPGHKILPMKTDRTTQTSPRSSFESFTTTGRLTPTHLQFARGSNIMRTDGPLTLSQVWGTWRRRPSRSPSPPVLCLPTRQPLSTPELGITTPSPSPVEGNIPGYLARQPTLTQLQSTRPTLESLLVQPPPLPELPMPTWHQGLSSPSLPESNISPQEPSSARSAISLESNIYTGRQRSTQSIIEREATLPTPTESSMTQWESIHPTPAAYVDVRKMPGLTQPVPRPESGMRQDAPQAESIVIHRPTAIRTHPLIRRRTSFPPLFTSTGGPSPMQLLTPAHPAPTEPVPPSRAPSPNVGRRPSRQAPPPLPLPAPARAAHPRPGVAARNRAFVGAALPPQPQFRVPPPPRALPPPSPWRRPPPPKQGLNQIQKRTSVGRQPCRGRAPVPPSTPLDPWAPKPWRARAWAPAPAAGEGAARARPPASRAPPAAPRARPPAPRAWPPAPRAPFPPQR